MNNSYSDKKGRYSIKPVTIKTVDQSCVDYFDKRLNIHVETGTEKRTKVPVIYATGERFALIRDNKGLRDDNGTLILPLISIRRTLIDRTPGNHGLGQETPSITVRRQIHSKTANIQNQLYARAVRGFPQPKREPVYEYLTIPFPDFANVYYEIIIWSQYQSQMNEILEKIFFNYDHLDSFVMPVEYDGHKRKGNSYYFVGFRDGNITPESNVQEFSDTERIIKYTYNIKVPAYFMLDPKDETLAYGKRKGVSSKDDGGDVIFKVQSTNEIKLSEKVLTAEEFEKLFG